MSPDQVPALADAFRAAAPATLGYSKLQNPRVAPEAVGTVADWLTQRLR